MNAIGNRNKRSGFIYFIIFLVIVIYFATRDDKNSPPPSTDAEYEELLEEAEETEDADLEPAILGEPSMTRNFYIIFDGSGSMDSYLNGEIKIVGAKKAIVKFLAQISDDVNMGLYLFDDYGTREMVPLEPINKDKLLAAVSASSPGGGTPLADAIIFATKQLRKQRKKQLGYGEYNLIIVTDGEASSLPEASTLAVKNEISIYALGLGIGEDHPLNDEKYVVSYTAADDFDQLTEALIEAVAESPIYDDQEFKQ